MTSKFQQVLDHIDVAVQLAESHLERAKTDAREKTREGKLAFVVHDTSEDIEGETGMEVAALLERSGREKVPYRFDAMTTRAFAYTAPVLAAAKLWDRDLADRRRGPEAVELIARTAMWLVGRSPLPDLRGLGVEVGAKGARRSEESTTNACRIAGLWLSKLSLARGIPSSFGGILTQGLDYFAMWACGSVAFRYYDDFVLTTDEALEVAQQALIFKRALVTALVRTARADGRFSFEEEELLTLFLDHLAFSDAEKEACLAEARPGARGGSDDVLSAVQLAEHREYIVARSVDMAFADRHETRSEKQAIRHLAKVLGVPEKLVSAHETTMRALNRSIGGR